MGRKSHKPPLHLVPPAPAAEDVPPRTLGYHGASLWNRIMCEYAITDAGGRELLALACQQLDRAEALKAQIDAEGEVIQTRNGPKDHPALRHELAARIRRQNAAPLGAERGAPAPQPRPSRRPWYRLDAAAMTAKRTPI